MQKNLTNGRLSISVDSHGAELVSIFSAGKELLWQADPKYWKRHAPVLFPIVGRLWKDTYRHQGNCYNMSQHGFARDMEFFPISTSDGSLCFFLKSNELTLEKYPFPFDLYIAYKIHFNTIEIIWEIKNTGNETMPFQIGAHPAFNLPFFSETEENHGYFSFDTNNILSYTLLQEEGCAGSKRHTLPLTEDGLLAINSENFGHDALIFEDNQIHDIHLLDSNKQPYISLHSEAPVFGLWTPPHSNAPFVCIEPWYGRCDTAEYTGEFKDKPWMQHLAPNEVFRTSYSISIDIKK